MKLLCEWRGGWTAVPSGRVAAGRLPPAGVMQQSPAGQIRRQGYATNPRKPKSWPISGCGGGKIICALCWMSLMTFVLKLLMLCIIINPYVLCGIKP